MSFCSNCGIELRNEARFCHSCGIAANSHTIPFSTKTDEVNARSLPFALWRHAGDLITPDQVKLIFPTAVSINTPSAPKILLGIHEFDIFDVPFSINFGFENNLLSSIVALPNAEVSEEFFNRLTVYLTLIYGNSFHLLEDKSDDFVRVINCHWLSGETVIRLSLTHFTVPDTVKCALFFEPQRSNIKKMRQKHIQIEAA